MNEFQLLHSLLKKIAVNDVTCNDAFFLPNPGDLVITKDVVIDGVHLISGSSGYLMAKKAIRVNLSDIASMGAKPLFYLMGLIANKSNTDQWFFDLCDGFYEENKLFDVKLVGGDTVFHHGSNILSITFVGSLPQGKLPLTRSGANLGDLVCVTGTIGDAAIGLLIHQKKISFKSEFLCSRYDFPEPRLLIADLLLNYASSCIDVSDGLLQDAEHICKESGVGMVLKMHEIPISCDVKLFLDNFPTQIELILSGGDDYELLFTIAPENYNKLIKKSLLYPEIRVTVIGEVTNGAEVDIIDEYGIKKHFLNKGFIHE